MGNEAVPSQIVNTFIVTMRDKREIEVKATGFRIDTGCAVFFRQYEDRPTSGANSSAVKAPVQAFGPHTWDRIQPKGEMRVCL